MAIEVFIVRSSAPHACAYSNSARENRGLQTSREDFTDNGSECAVAVSWHTYSLCFVVPGDDYSSTACIEFDAASRERAVWSGQPESRFDVFGDGRRLHRSAAGACRRAIPKATRASNGSPARPQALEVGKS